MTQDVSISAKEKELVSKVADHMQFLGYETQISASNPFFIRASHPQYSDIIIRVSSNYISFTNRFNTNDLARTHRLDFLEYLNSLNQQSIASQFISDNDQGTLNVHICLLVPYDKVIYGRFVQVWNNDLKLIGDHEKSAAFLK
jgi:hypothetical protein